MGVDKTDYVMVGYKLTKDECQLFDVMDEYLLPYVEGRPGIEMSLIFDMNGDDVIFGKTITKFYNYEYELNFREIDISNIKYDMENVHSEFNQVFERFNIKRVEQPKLIAFSNIH